MTERIPKSLLLASLALLPLALAYFAYSGPWYFLARFDFSIRPHTRAAEPAVVGIAPIP
jgi:hypothetical protein